MTTSPFLSNIIRRPRLFKLLNRGRHYSVSWLSGPAGSGKTTLAADFLQTHKLDHIWYRLNEQDNDFSVFFSNLNRALLQIRIKPNKKIKPFEADFGMRPLELSRRFFEALSQRITTTFYLVLDDYQVLNKDSLLHVLLKEGITRLTPWIHVMVISREDPPKMFSALLANNQLRLINGPHDLCFSLTETVSLIRRETGKDWPKEFIAAIYEKTGGWATGLTLIAKGLHVLKNELLPFNDLPLARIYEYFASELFDRMDTDMRRLLLSAALLPRVVPEIVQTLTGNSKAGSLLNDLFKSNYFMERYGARPPVYQFHPLFREFLLSQAFKELPDKEIKSIRFRAAVLFEKSGLLNEAIKLYQQARGYPEIAGIILTHSADMIRQSRFKTVAQWLEALPENVIRRDPWLNYWQGVGRKYETPTESKKQFRKAFDQFRKTGHKDGILLAWAGAVESTGNDWSSWKELDYYSKWFDRHIRPGYKFPSAEIEIQVIAGVLLLLLMRTPHHPDQEYWISRALALSAENRAVSLKAFILVVVIMVLFYRQAPADRLETLRTELSLLSAQKESDLIVCCRAYIEPLSFFWRDLTPEAALEIVEQTIASIKKTEIHFLDEYVFGIGTLCASVLKDFQRAQTYLEYFEDCLKQRKRQEVLTLYYLLKSLFHAARHETGPALDFGLRAAHATSFAGFILSQPLAHLNLAGLFIQKQKYGEAESHLVLAQKQSRKYKSLRLKYHADLLKAYWTVCRGDEDRGLRLLRRTLAEGRRFGFIRFIWWWNREVLTGICGLALENEIEPDFVRQMIRSYRLEPIASKTDWSERFGRIEIETLGQFRLKINGRSLEPGKKAKVVQLEMLKLLVAFGPEPVSIEKIKTLLWPDKTGIQTASAFSSTLNRLRNLLGTKEVIRVQEHKISIDPQGCTVDIHSLENWIDQACSCDAKSPDRFHFLEKAVNAYQGRFLENEAEKNWILEKQNKLKNKYLAAVMELGAWHERRQKPRQALDLYKRASAFEPAKESLYLRLMSVQLQLKQNTEALKTYLRCRDNLQALLGLAPSEEMQGLYRRLSNADPSPEKTARKIGYLAPRP